MNRTFVGIGFGPIQAGIFLYEAFHSGNFNRLVVAEVMPETVAVVRRAGGQCWVNVAAASGVQPCPISGIEIFNPDDERDRRDLIAALAGAREIATALPSVACFTTGGEKSVAALLAAGIKARLAAGNRAPCVIYAAENHNQAAEILWQAIAGRLGDWSAKAPECVQGLNTVIGKMSGVVTDEDQIREQKLKRIAGAAGRCFLVEAFNRILISKIKWPDFQRGIPVFEEKNDLLPFEEAKLYGHNATHALLGYLARRKGYRFIAEVSNDAALLELARAAFLEESGAALCGKYRGLDDLFTGPGYRAYVDDLLPRMLNPHLRDTVARVVRDPRRKLGWDDRLIGTMRRALSQGVKPRRYALGARAALEMLAETEQEKDRGKLLDEVWQNSGAAKEEMNKIKELVLHEN